MEAAEAVQTQDPPTEESPPCYGLYWEAVGNSPCTKCETRKSCLHGFATGELPKLQARLGAAADDVGKLASASQVSEPALRIAIAYAAKLKANAAPNQRKPRSRRSTEAKKPAPTAPTERALAPPAPSVGKRKRRRRKRSWGKHTFEARWLRERERCPAIARLTPGHKIVREYKGVSHTIQVLMGRYVHQGKEYPTLYAVTAAITGTKAARKQRRTAGDESTRPDGKRKLCSWSATRFFAAALHSMG